MKKRYEVRGMMEWHPVFRVGRTRLQVSFTGGHLCGGACTPAVFETADPVVQAVIEGSEAFRSGRISASGGSAERMTSSALSAPETVMEFEDIDSASDYLQGMKGIPIDRVLTRTQCEAEAKELGIRLMIKSDVKA